MALASASVRFTWVIEGRNDLTDAELIVNRQLDMFTKKVALPLPSFF